MDQLGCGVAIGGVDLDLVLRIKYKCFNIWHDAIIFKLMSYVIMLRTIWCISNNISILIKLGKYQTFDFVFETLTESYNAQ